MTSPAVDEVVVETLPFGGSALARAMLDGTLPGALDARALMGRGAIVAHARMVLSRFTPARRAALEAWLGDATALSAAPEPVRTRLTAAVQQGLVITTGQQPGLFGGPLYTWHKALSAIALADALTELLQLPVAPLFWAATDDADFAEGQATWLPTHAGAQRIAIEAPPLAGGTRPVSTLPLPEMAAAIGALEAAAGSNADAQVLAVARSAYRAPHTVGDAYVALLRGLLESRGMAVLDASHVSVRRAAHDITSGALRRAVEVDAALVIRERALAAAGHVAQVERMEGQSLVFAWTADGKQRVSIAEAASRAVAAAPGTLSGNVLLRPIIESALLPTAAYVAGPGELAYFAQLGAVADALGVDVPRAVARWSARVLEPRVQRAVDALGIPTAAYADAERVLHDLSSAALPEATRTALADARAQLDASMRAVAIATESLALPSPVLDGAQRQIGHRLERLERRIVAHAARQDGARRAQVQLVAGSLYPGGTAQERRLNALPLLARFGDALWTAWRAGAARWARSLLSD
ncbi:MAG: bacillithiol biosynthesis BshC [Gemmatimonadaceae bacterium]|nr:bacillithiol biosynthesis BshC [Gemmatimonadaceae bacterium]